MTGWVLRVILLLVVIRLIWRFLSGIIDGLSPESRARARAQSGQGGRPGAPPPGGAASVPLVRDPVCGTYVVREKALTSGRGETTNYFCSEKCRDEFRDRG